VSEIAFIEAASQMSGVEFSTLYLAQSLNRNHFKPIVICPEDGDLPLRCRNAGVEVCIIQRPNFFSTSTQFAGHPIPNPFAIMANIAVIFASARRLARFLRERRPALVVPKGLLAQFYGGLAARWANLPCVWHIQDRVSYRVGPLFAWTLALTGRVLAREIIVDAKSIARQLVPLVPRERVHVIWNGVNTSEFSPWIDGSVLRREWGARETDLLIGSVGRLTRWKGQHILIQALDRLALRYPEARIVLVGAALFDSDTYARELEALVKQSSLQSRVVFAGFRWDMPQVFAAFDIVAHTALDKDSSPLAIVSAMASGKPIVCSRVDGTEELFDDGKDGLLFAPGNLDELTEKLAQILRDDDLRRRLGRGARIKAERELSIEKFSLECEAVFQKSTGP
jgi:glycosyltransferase involved in cell wall biosynthesis